MRLHKFDAEQVKSAVTILQACGIDPTAQTIEALVETAETHYLNDPASLEKVARSLVAFFGHTTLAQAAQEPSWQRLRQWAFSVLRL